MALWFRAEHMTTSGSGQRDVRAPVASSGRRRGGAVAAISTEARNVRLVARAVEGAAAALAASAAALGVSQLASPLAALFLVPGAVLAGTVALLLLMGRPAVAAHAAGVAIVPFAGSIIGTMPYEASPPGSWLLMAVAPSALLGLTMIMAWGAEERRRHAWGVQFHDALARTTGMATTPRRPVAPTVQSARVPVDVWAHVR